MSKGTGEWASAQRRAGRKSILPLGKGEAGGMIEKGLSNSGGERV